MDKTQWHATSGFIRWLIATRASVFPLTVFAVTFAACLARPDTAIEWAMTAIVLLALVLAHATNNLINDYVDHAAGLDTDNYFRTQYGVHPLASGLLSRTGYRRYIALTGSAALILGVAVCSYRGGITYLFAGLGAFFVLFYTYPLKRIALGEIAVFATWGPLMVGGAHLAITAEVSAAVLWAGAVYGLGPAVVIFAKHTDKAVHDKAKHIWTLPLLLGKRARYATALLALLQLPAAIVVAYLFELPGLLGILVAIPALTRLVEVVRSPAPQTCPPDYPERAWPLWYTTRAFLFARDAGFGLTAGILAQHVLG